MKIFSLKGGLELFDSDGMETVEGHTYLFYSFGKLIIKSQIMVSI